MAVSLLICLFFFILGLFLFLFLFFVSMLQELLPYSTNMFLRFHVQGSVYMGTANFKSGVCAFQGLDM